MIKHYNIPIFLPELACPYRCVYCNQFHITGNSDVVRPEDVKKIMNNKERVLLVLGKPTCGYCTLLLEVFDTILKEYQVSFCISFLAVATHFVWGL